MNHKQPKFVIIFCFVPKCFHVSKRHCRVLLWVCPDSILPETFLLLSFCPKTRQSRLTSFFFDIVIKNKQYLTRMSNYNFILEKGKNILKLLIFGKKKKCKSMKKIAFVYAGKKLCLKQKEREEGGERKEIGGKHDTRKVILSLLLFSV